MIPVKCKNCADKLSKFLTSKGIAHDIIEIYSEGIIGYPTIDAAITANGKHYGVGIPSLGKVFDNVHITGIESSKWMSSFLHTAIPNLSIFKQIKFKK